MERKYKPTSLYLIKTIGLTVATLAGFVFIYTFYSLFTAGLNKIAIIIINVFFLIFFLIAILFIILNLLKGKPSIITGEDYIKLNYRKFLLSDIKEFRKSKGGSEPLIVMMNNDSHTLELSWFKKEDQKEIIEFLEHNL